MLGPAYFELIQKIHYAKSFEDVVLVLTEELAALLGAAEVGVVEADDGVYLTAHGEGRLIGELNAHMDFVNANYGELPLSQQWDFNNPGYLGFALSDVISEGDSSVTDYVKAIHGDAGPSDLMCGMLLHGSWRHANLVAFWETGTVTEDIREKFNAVLLTVRGVLERLAAEAFQRRVQEQLYMTRSDSALALFVVNIENEVLPLNHPAVRCSEGWWSMDEPVRALPEEACRLMGEAIKTAWRNPVDMEWQAVTLNLGGGDMSMGVLPRVDGETLLAFSIGRRPGDHAGPEEMLTKRQREIMEWIAQGKTSAEASIILNISARTVEKHLEAVFQRLGVENRIAAVRRYLELKHGVL